MFLFEIVSIYPQDVILSIASVLKPYMKYCIQNPNGECRAFGRKALLVWQQIDPHNSERVYHSIDQAMQRAVLEDEYKYVVNAIKRGSLEQRSHLVHDANTSPAQPRVISS